MKTNTVLIAMVGAAIAAPQGQKSPEGSAPSGCKSSYDGDFTISIIAPPAGSSKEKRQSEGAKPLTLKLKDGVLTDQDGRIGSIVANHQFQFDNPVQEDAIYTSGFAVCDDNLLAIGGNKTFYKCASGEFSNLYDEPLGEHCQAIAFTVSSSGGSSGGSGGSGGSSGGGGGEGVTQIDDGQPQGPTGTPPKGEPVTQIPDGQPQAPTGEPVSQIPDGQPQAPTGEPVSQIPDGQPQAPTGEPVTQIPDGQPQAPTGEPPKGEPVTQIPDGQPQAPTGEPPKGEPVTQIPDGQPQAPTGAPPVGEPVTQIPDGQPQAPTGAPPAGETISQIPDGQPQAPTGSPPAPQPSGQEISQIPDGQPQAPTDIPIPAANTSIPSVSPNVGGKVHPGPVVALIVGLAGVVYMF